MLEDNWDPGEAAAAQTVIGSDSFVDKIRRGWAGLSEKASVLRESGNKKALASWVELESVITAVEDEYGCARENLLRRWSRSNEPRQVLLYLAVKYCRGQNTLTGLAEELVPISISGLTRAKQLMEEKMKKDRKLRSRVGNLEKSLTENSNS